MPSRDNSIEILPSASRLMGSLRDLGYDFPQAVADLVDNSISADARRVSIDLVFEGPETWLRIADDGHGMGGAEITEAMRYGARQSYGDEDLGKFGLGLKTASLSQCRHLTVASRSSASRRRIEVRELDLDHVTDHDRWEVLVPHPARIDERASFPLEKQAGTVILWQSLDRVLGYKIPWGGKARRAVEQLADQLRDHLGMIFHRFLSGEADGRRRVVITVNGRKAIPWDPFARDEVATIVLPPVDIDLATPDGIGLVRFQPFVLPNRERFSSEESFHRLGGPRKWNAQQGLYIYRANRMLQSGGWCRLRAPDEHLKLARASLDFYPELDPAFEVNVAKVRAVLPTDLRERLRPAVEMLVRAAQRAYRLHGDEAEAARRVPRRNRAAPSDVRKALQTAARRSGQLAALRAIMREMKISAPGIADSLGWGKRQSR